MGKTFTVDILSPSSIEKLKKDLQQYQKDLKTKTENFASRLAERGVEIAKMKIVELDAVFSGELLESIIHERDLNSENRYDAVFVVVADSTHAAFVEFGTGYRGLNSSYPYNFPDGVTWNYNTGKTIRHNEATGTYYWFYPGDDGKWHYTEGMPSRPFLYETANQLRQEVEEIAREVFADA